MPVVINEFEVVTEPAAQPAALSESSGADAPAQEPVDVERVMADRRAREERVRAY